MAQNLTQKLIAEHLVEGDMTPGEPVAFRIDQTLTQDATGTLVMLILEALGLERVRTELSAQYVDHNLLQTDHKNQDDHRFLESACRRFGIWYSRPGNGVSHPVHMQCFGRPGKTMLGADSHTPAAGSLGMLAIGAGGMDVAAAMAGEPYRIEMPAVWGVHLSGELPPWVSAKDVILEMLRRHGVAGGVGRIIEYHGPGVAGLGAMDRHVIANMGAELGATSSVFPSDDAIRSFLADQGRDDHWFSLAADKSAGYDVEDEIDLGTLEPLIATPSSPDNVVPVREVAGRPVHQSYIGSSANPGYRDFAIAAEMVRGRTVPASVSFDINPTSRQLLESLARNGHLGDLLEAGARLHQTGCNGCIGMGQAPGSEMNSLRTVPRNFPGRSGTADDNVYLCSPETATAAALTGVITDPRNLDMRYPNVGSPENPERMHEDLLVPPDADDTRAELVKGPNIGLLPEFDALADHLRLPVLLKAGDNVSTDEIMPAGTRVLPFRSNIQKISDFAFERIDATYAARADRLGRDRSHAVIAGRNYGQGSSREHAAVAPRYRGLRAVVAQSFARIHRQNLINYGVLPLVFADADRIDDVDKEDVLVFKNLVETLDANADIEAEVEGAGRSLTLRLVATARDVDILRAGGLINWLRAR